MALPIQILVDASDPLSQARFWARALHYEVEDTTELINRVLDKNRVHLDLSVGDEQRAAEVDRLRGLGAEILYEVDEPAGHHVTMADPEGNEFCVQ